MPTVIGLIRPGTDASLEVWRDRSTKRISVWVAELEPAPTQLLAKDAATPEGAAVADRLGLVVRELSAEERSAGGEGVPAGALIVERARGAAADAGIRRGDLILGVNGKRIKSAKEYRDTVAQGGKVVALLVQRDEQQVFIPVRPG
ncbi:MAG: PDZ domain-containing protein [Gammaproteobacteria bacterium]